MKESNVYIIQNRVRYKGFGFRGKRDSL